MIERRRIFRRIWFFVIVIAILIGSAFFSYNFSQKSVIKRTHEKRIKVGEGRTVVEKVGFLDSQGETEIEKKPVVVEIEENPVIENNPSEQGNLKCKTHFKMAYIYLLDPQVYNNDGLVSDLESAKAVGEEMLNIAGRGKVTFDLTYPVFDMHLTSSNREQLLISDIGGERIDLNLPEIAKEFYRHNPDNFEFLSIFTNFDRKSPEIRRKRFVFHQPVQRTAGIINENLVFYDNSSLYGSHGKLQGINYLGNVAYFLADKEFSKHQLYCMAANSLVHETTHNWAAYIGQLFGQSGNKFILQNRFGAHWFQGLDLNYDPVGGGRWQDNGDGTFTLLPHETFCSPQDFNVPSRYGIEKMSDLTLYLIGALQIEDVKPVLWIEYDGPLDVGTTVHAESRNISIEDIIAQEGNRECRL